MCIALLSTAHPSYHLILIDNRDEYLNRPTAPATWWPDQSHVFGGRDLLRDVQGTWLGITKAGKIAVLTNFREDTSSPSPAAVSRGAIIRKWLADDVGSTEQFVHDIIDTGIARDAGGFSLVCGNIGERLAVISNRAQDRNQVPWICGDVVQTIGLSNAAFLDHSWPKIIQGEELMLDAIRANIHDEADENKLIEGLLDVLSRDTLKRVGKGPQEPIESYVKELRNTIFVPVLGRGQAAPLKGDELAAAQKSERVEVRDIRDPQIQQVGTSGLYGTQKQTVVLVGHDMRVRFFERTLYDEVPNPVPRGHGDIDIEFQIDAEKNR